MALDNHTSDVLIKRLSWRADYILNSMISFRDPVPTTIIQRTLGASSIGLLDTLPLELLHSIFNLLDFQSLAHFVLVCHQGKAIVESLPAYRDVVKQASMALNALNRTELITFHPVTSIHAALLSENCVSCQQFAPFLFLPTFER